MKNKRKDCYFYYESQEMSAYVPNCSYDSLYEYGFCPCYENCKHYISSREAHELIIKAVNDGINTVIGEVMSENNKDMVNHLNHYAGNIEVIDYIRDKLTPEGFTEYCCGNVLKYISRWRKKDGIQDLKKAKVYLEWMIDSAEKENA